MKKYQLLQKLFMGAKRYYFIAILSSVLNVFFFTLTPLILRVAIDSVVGTSKVNKTHIFIDWFVELLPEGRVEALGFCVVFFLVLTLFSALFEYFQSYFAIKSSDTMSKGLRDNLYNHILNLPKATISKTQTGDLLQRCTTDVEVVTTFFANHFIKVFKTILLIVIVLYFMLTLDFKMTGISMSLIPFMFIYCIYFFKRVSKYFEQAEKAESGLSRVLQENLTGVRVVKAFARQSYEEDKFNRENLDYKNKDFSVAKAFGEFWTVTECFSALQMGLVLILGAYFTLTSSIEVGIIVAFLSYTGEILWPVKELSMVLAEGGRAKVSLKRIKEVLQNKKEVIDEDKVEPEILGDIEFRNVSFSFGNTEVLKNVSFKVERGQSIGILGESGSGKTTLVHLLHQVYDNYTGDILIDGVDIRRINKRHIRKKIALILQDPYLFNRSIKENIIFGIDGASQFEVERVANKSCIHDSIMSFDKGYQTMVGESGVTLSGGQKQRLSIARSLILDTPIVVFDDSLSAVDSSTDRAIRKKLKDSNPTSIIISHRISTLKDADQILVLEHGEVKAYGTHEEIKDKDTLYKRILDIQDEVKESFEISLEEEVNV